jgi:tRNA-2-methylthio-N6-dimethylallyladenosine synthase/ribosomal protein S12 methylthiotransferase
VDTERLLGSLGTPVETVEDMRRARLALINTCGFIAPAVKESVREILGAADRVARLRAKPLLVVAGCLVGRYGKETLAKDMPEVDLWLPAEDRENWPRTLARALRLDAPPETGARLLSTGPAYAYLKIAEGCRHACSFCTIPAIRGPLRSVPEPALLAEARTLLETGIREIDLVAQDLTDYGRDLHGESRLAGLLASLAELPGLSRLRMLYCHPAGVTDGLLRAIRDIGPPLLPYLDIPLQHADPDILASMGRPFAGDPRKVLDRVRSALPGAVLRSTFIVGYPGETEERFERLAGFLEEAALQHVGVFVYEAEEGTRAARMPGKVPRATARERKRILMELQAEISAGFLATHVGTMLDVLVDAPHPEWEGLHRGRAWFQAPEVDGITYVSGPRVFPGAMVKAEVVESGDHDLTALTDAEE